MNWPRQWAALVSDGRATLAEVPESLREWVEKLVDRQLGVTHAKSLDIRVGLRAQRKRLPGFAEMEPEQQRRVREGIKCEFHRRSWRQRKSLGRV